MTPNTAVFLILQFFASPESGNMGGGGRLYFKTLINHEQESGRAGRDGAVSKCVLLYQPSDYFRISTMVASEASGLSNAYDMLGYCITGGSHTHVSGSHTHISGSHTHISGSHTHVSGSHTPVSGSHTHVSGSHTHVSGSHTPVSGSHRTLVVTYAH